MPIVLLAPVPTMHLADAIETCARMGRVAFGTNAIELVHQVAEEFGEGLPVFIYPTATGGGDKGLLTPGFASYGARFVQKRFPNPGGMHPEPDYRPRSTLGPGGDTAWTMFWEVSDLAPLQQHVQLTDLRARGRKSRFAKGAPIRGPMLVEAPA